VKPEKCIQDLQEELVRKDEKLRHYEKKLLRAKSLEVELTAAREKTMEQANAIRKMECDEEKQKIKFRQLEERLKKSGVNPRVKKMEAKVKSVFKFLRNKESEFYDLQSQVAMKKQEIERLDAELKTAALDLTRYKEENIQLHTKIQALEDQVQYNRKKKDKVERDKQPISCTTQMFQQNDIRHSNLNFQAKSQHDPISDEAVLMAISLITDTGAPPANNLLTNHIKNPTFLSKP
jgi:chromosome segregation ATPase